VLRNGRHFEVVLEFAFDIMQFKYPFMSKMNKYVWIVFSKTYPRLQKCYYSQRLS